MGYIYVCITNYIFCGFVCLFENGNVPSIQWTTIGMLEDILCFYGDMISNLWMKMDMNAIRMGFHLFDYFFSKVQNHTSLTIDG
jgi:hypothetical protein